ncbi:HAD family hydrolase [Rhodococcoides kyotonense]|uniref:Phosphoglycolate phosphatase/pyrophosphatase PpaX n=1 Tax=Rhodococcoides kyotonense TaxID=398843 RepID=A0A239IM49_9NOCA|nr:HAD hydrolase-like protein [Rhodococcus kyotonensis]SNS94288.1 phosphoglycolate phosphatase/pyrophosphatase PpaX [Rhodococcus kyotonensis]
MAHDSGILFDFDGTLVDSGGAILAAYRRTFEEELGVPLPAELEDVHVLMAPRPIEVFATWSDGDPAELVQAYGRHYIGGAYENVRPYDGTFELISELTSSGTKFGIVTNKSRKRLLLDLDWVGIDPALLSCLVTADDSVQRKPDPTPIYIGIERSGIDPAGSWYVGDGPQDILAGRAAGLGTAGANYGYYGAELLSPHGPDRSLDTPLEALGILASSLPHS